MATVRNATPTRSRPSGPDVAPTMSWERAMRETIPQRRATDTTATASTPLVTATTLLT